MLTHDFFFFFFSIFRFSACFALLRCWISFNENIISMLKMYVLCTLFVNGHVYVNAQWRAHHSNSIAPSFLCTPKAYKWHPRHAYTPSTSSPINFTFTFGDAAAVAAYIKLSLCMWRLPYMSRVCAFCCVFLGYLYIYACKVDNKRFCRLSMGLNFVCA